MAEELRDNLKALEPGLSNIHLTSLPWDEAKSWPCSRALHSSQFKWARLHGMPAQLPGTLWQEDFSGLHLMGSYNFQLQSWITQCHLGDPLQWSRCVQPCPSEWGPKPRLWDLPSGSCTQPPSIQQRSLNLQIFQQNPNRQVTKKKTQHQTPTKKWFSVSLLSICSDQYRNSPCSS